MSDAAKNGMNLLVNWARKRMSAEDPKRVLPTVGFPALQFNTAKKQFVATRKVPSADIQTDEMPARYQPLKP